MRRFTLLVVMSSAWLGACGGEAPASTASTPQEALDQGIEDMGGVDAASMLDAGEPRDAASSGADGCEQLTACLIACDEDPFVCSARCSQGGAPEVRASAAGLALCLDAAGCEDDACAWRACEQDVLACRGEAVEPPDMGTPPGDMGGEDMTSPGDMPGGMMLPEAGYTACEGKTRMEACTWTSRMGEIMGVCIRIPQSIDTRQFCVPEDRLGGRDMGG